MSMTADRDLSTVLGRLESHWRQQQVPIIDALLPGLSDAEIDDLVDPLGIQLPDELRIWWRWHGGVPSTAGRVAQIGPLWEYLTLVDSAEVCRMNRMSAAKEAAEATERWWLDSWLPVVISVIAPLLTADCSGPSDAPVPILIVDSTDLTYFTPKAPSFTAVVAIWVDAFDTGLISYNAAQGEWHRGDVPIELDRLLL